MSTTLPVLDPLLHQPARTQLVAFLSGRGEATFSELKRVLGVTDGNLGAHLNKLVEAGYVESREETSGPRAQTVFSLTPGGRAALAEYVARLSALMQMSTGSEAPPAALFAMLEPKA
ncbi:MAG: helix-turn-helix domain-containing protein [Zoogloea sp.]|nr:helix-turn-helix domain-containing protein [Zoogloea sp.]